jgi:hypothetical protein
MLAGEADSVIAVSAWVTVKLAPVAVLPLKLLSPEYVAVTGYVPAASELAVGQLVVVSVATHSVDPPDAKVTVPVAPPGSPDTDSVSCDP